MHTSFTEKRKANRFWDVSKGTSNEELPLLIFNINIGSSKNDITDQSLRICKWNMNFNHWWFQVLEQLTLPLEQHFVICYMNESKIDNRSVMGITGSNFKLTHLHRHTTLKALRLSHFSPLRIPRPLSVPVESFSKVKFFGQFGFSFLHSIFSSSMTF